MPSGRPLTIGRWPVGKAAGASMAALGAALALGLAFPSIPPFWKTSVLTQAKVEPKTQKAAALEAKKPDLVFPFAFARLPLHQRSTFGPVLVSIRPPGTAPFAAVEAEEAPLPPVEPSQAIAALIDVPLPAPRPLALREPDAFPPLPPLRPAVMPQDTQSAAPAAGPAEPAASVAQPAQAQPTQTPPAAAEAPASATQAPAAHPPAAVAALPEQKLPKPGEEKSFFDRLFSREPAKLTSLAYAPETEDTTRKRVAVLTHRYDRYTAVYDITARVLYMPDGTRIEAHSGLGERLDDVRYVYERNHGPTPPHLYDLSQRAQSFHGITALRMTPVGKGDVYGRVGLLAHPFMMGPNGDSNGCVSIKDYNAFLQAYRTGEVKRIAVVASLD